MVSAQSAAVLPYEQPRGRQRRTAEPQVLGERVDPLRRQMDRAVAAGLRRSFHGAGVGLDDLTVHRDRPRLDGHVSDAQGQEFAQAQVSPESELKETSEVVGHAGQEPMNLLEVEKPPRLAASLGGAP